MFDPPPAERVRVFISYKHKVEPDQSVVDQVVRALEPHHTVFIDKKILPGLEWGKWIHDRFRVHDKGDLVAGLCEVMRRNTCDDETIFFRLRGAGLVQRAGQSVQMRRPLYAEYFREHLKCHQR
jgi:hypothetical protein